MILLAACGGGAAGQQAKSADATGYRMPEPANAHDYPYELNPMIDSLNKSDYDGAAAFLAQHVDQCLASKDCRYDAEVLYYNWANAYENAGDWQGARKTLQDCVETLHQDAVCSGRLTDLESRHHF